METTFIPTGICSTAIHFQIENGIVKKVNYESGCQGNLTAISRLIEGMEVEAVIEKLQGVKCGRKNTSCADQLAKALKQQLKG